MRGLSRRSSLLRCCSIISAMPLRPKLSTQASWSSIVANFDNEWELTSADIDAAVAALRGDRAA